MSEHSSILVLGLGPLASAAARLLFLAGYAVALRQIADPKVLRRKASAILVESTGEKSSVGSGATSVP